MGQNRSESSLHDTIAGESDSLLSSFDTYRLCEKWQLFPSLFFLPGWKRAILMFFNMLITNINIKIFNFAAIESDKQKQQSPIAITLSRYNN